MNSCGTVEPKLSAYLDGELADGERRAVRAHLEMCARCVEELKGLRVASRLLTAAPVRRLPDAVRAHVVAAAQDAQAPTSATPSPVLVRVLAAVIALIGSLGVTAFVAGGDAPPAQRPMVEVPVDVFVADHLVQSGGMPMSTPAVFEGQP